MHMHLQRRQLAEEPPVGCSSNRCPLQQHSGLPLQQCSSPFAAALADFATATVAGDIRMRLVCEEGGRGGNQDVMAAGQLTQTRWRSDGGTTWENGGKAMAARQMSYVQEDIEGREGVRTLSSESRRGQFRTLYLCISCIGIFEIFFALLCKV